MKKLMIVLTVVVAASVVGNSSGKPAPRVHLLPDNASARAQERTQQTVPANVAVPVAVPVALPPAPPVVPPVVATAIGGSGSGSSGQATEADRAIASATETVKAKLAASTNISIITMTATRTSRRVTPFRPSGRAGDAEILTFRFTDRFGRKIGTGSMLCRWVVVTRRLCWGEARLPRGKLVALGSSQTRVLGEFAIIGGTGVYLFRQGMMSFKATSVGKFAVRVLLA